MARKTPAEQDLRQQRALQRALDLLSDARNLARLLQLYRTESALAQEDVAIQYVFSWDQSARRAERCRRKLELILAAIDSLPSIAQRITLRGLFVDGLNAEQVAETLDCDRRTVYYYRRRGLLRVGELLEQLGDREELAPLLAAAE